VFYPLLNTELSGKCEDRASFECRTYIISSSFIRFDTNFYINSE